MGRVDQHSKTQAARRTAETQVLNQTSQAARIVGQEEKGLWASALVLAGLYNDAAMIAMLKREVCNMRESTTYQEILAEGRIEGEQDMLLTVGRKKLGTPNQLVTSTIRETNDLERLKNMAERLFEVESWEDLINTAKPKQSNTRPKRKS